MEDSTKRQHGGRGCLGWGCLLSILVPISLLVCPLPETPIRAYPVYGKPDFDVLDHKVILSLGAFEQDEQSRYGMKRGFNVWVDVPNERWGEAQVTVRCKKIDYRLDGGSWKKAERLPEGDDRGGGSARIWFWSPAAEDLESLDASRRSYKMRPGSYELRVEFESDDGASQTIETTFSLQEKTERHWRSLLDNLRGLSGIH